MLKDRLLVEEYYYQEKSSVDFVVSILNGLLRHVDTAETADLLLAQNEFVAQLAASRGEKKYLTEVNVAGFMKIRFAAVSTELFRGNDGDLVDQDGNKIEQSQMTSVSNRLYFCVEVDHRANEQKIFEQVRRYFLGLRRDGKIEDVVEELGESGTDCYGRVKAYLTRDNITSCVDRKLVRIESLNKITAEGELS